MFVYVMSIFVGVFVAAVFKKIITPVFYNLIMSDKLKKTELIILAGFTFDMLPVGILVGVSSIIYLLFS